MSDHGGEGQTGYFAPPPTIPGWWSDHSALGGIDALADYHEEEANTEAVEAVQDAPACGLLLGGLLLQPQNPTNSRQIPTTLFQQTLTNPLQQGMME